jgi:hypothetical protein
MDPRLDELVGQIVTVWSAGGSLYVTGLLATHPQGYRVLIDEFELYGAAALFDTTDVDWERTRETRIVLWGDK